MNKKGWWVAIAIMGSLTACAVIPGSNESSSLPHSQRLVVQFKPHRHACNAAGIAALARDTGVPLVLVRSQGKGACIVNHFARHPDHFLRQQNRIAEHDSIQWVEPDRRMHAL